MFHADAVNSRPLLPEPSNIQSDVSDRQPPPPQPDSSPCRRQTSNGFHTAPGTPTPDLARLTSHIRSESSSGTRVFSPARIEVVLKLSPHRPSPEHGRYYGEDDLGDVQIVRPDLLPKPNRSKPAVLAAVQNRCTPGTPGTPGTPAGMDMPTAPVTTGARRGRSRAKAGLPPSCTHKHLYFDDTIRAATDASVLKGAAGARPKRRGRPPRRPSPTPRAVWEKLVVPPKYVAFMCEWAGCQGELQNCQTLRRHIGVVHAHMGRLVCRWGKCEGKETAFTGAQEFWDHVDNEHLEPLRWHVGDGPRNAGGVESSEREAVPPAYLLGPDGKQITPWVRYQEPEDDAAWRERRRRLKNILMQRDAHAPSEEGSQCKSGSE